MKFGKEMNEKEREIFSAILGEKKIDIIEFLVQNSDQNGFVWVKISQICQTLGVSKPTVIEIFSLLQTRKIFKRVKNGLYKFEFKVQPQPPAEIDDQL